MAVGNGLKLIPVEPRHRDLLLRWVNELSSLRGKHLTTARVEPADHQAWFAARLADPDCCIWIIEVEGTEAGQVRLQRREAVFEVDIFVVPGSRGRGLASAALRRAIAILREWRGGETPVEAVVRRENAASHRLFRMLGFSVVIDDGAVLRYRLPAYAHMSGEGTAGGVVLPPASQRGWRHLRKGDLNIWVVGRIRGLDETAIVDRLATLDGNMDCRDVEALLSGLNGHFALMAEMPDWFLAVVDRVCSWPVFWARRDDGSVRITAHAPTLAEDCGISEIDPQGSLSLAMAGYTTGSRTVYRGLHSLRPGEYLFGDRKNVVQARRYHTYTPWKVRATPEDQLAEKLGDVTLTILHRILDRAAGRTIVVPLSGGFDSRLVVSGLRHLGAGNVRCFSYGLTGNFEAAAAQEISQRLGFEWRFVPLDHIRQRRFFGSDLHRRYTEFADSLYSVPFEQDLPVLEELLKDGWIDPSSIMINGNSGDYISGGHIAPVLRKPHGEKAPQARRQIVLDALINKHYALWSSLLTRENRKALREMIAAEIDGVCPADLPPESEHGAYEFSEFTNRQSKYVISGQRVYDFLGLEWELPLWDDDYLEFWSDVPLEFKVGQKLYARMLMERNWGNVWKDLPVNRKWISPAWIRLPRHAVRLLAAPLGRDTWHRLEKRLFAYWMDLVGNYGVVRYRDIVLDGRGHRNPISWHNEVYLRSKGIGYDGKPFPADAAAAPGGE